MGSFPVLLSRVFDVTIIYTRIIYCGEALKVVTIPMFGCEQGLATPFLFVDDAPTNHWIVGISKQTYEEGIVATLAFRHAVDSKKGFRPGGSR